MNANVVALLIIAAGWTIAAGTLKLVAKHCQRGIDAARAMNDESVARLDASKASIDESKTNIEAALASNRRLIDLYAAISGDPSSPEAVAARAAAAELARWN